MAEVASYYGGICSVYVLQMSGGGGRLVCMIWTIIKRFRGDLRCVVKDDVNV